MAKPLRRTNREITEIYERQFDTVYRVCFMYMKNEADADDAAQETFFRLIHKGPAFESCAHEKAWLIRTAANICKDMLRKASRRHEPLYDHAEIAAPSDPHYRDLYDSILALPAKYKEVIYLYYYEGFNTAEIADILKRPGSTVRNYLSEARKLLKERLGDDLNEE